MPGEAGWAQAYWFERSGRRLLFDEGMIAVSDRWWNPVCRRTTLRPEPGRRLVGPRWTETLRLANPTGLRPTRQGPLAERKT